ncbi:MAG: hypothetical protein FJW27_01255 [Acidimicrobiia bacterium]|nr:hypothetical protein [Acidimicrobiia bacterium]
MNAARRESGPTGPAALALTCLALAGLAKESFVILVPALLLFWLTCHRWFHGDSWGHALRALRGTLAVGISIFSLHIALVLATLMALPAGYSGSMVGLLSASFDPKHWLDLVSVVPLTVRIALVATIAVAGLTWIEQPRRR